MNLGIHKMKNTDFLFLTMLFVMVLISGCAPALQKAAESGDIDKVRALIKDGVNINEKGSYGSTALQWAAFTGRSDIVQILLDAGANVNIKNDFGDTALHGAAYSGSIETANLLLNKGADINATGDEGKTPLVYAAERYHGDMIKFLISRGADLDTALAWTEAHASHEGAAKLLAKFAQKQEAVRAPLAVNNPVAEGQQTLTIKSDIDELPPPMAKSNKNSYAVVIGIENYRQKLPKADFATRDAQTVTDYLTKVLGYPEENVVTLLNDHATNVDLAKYLEQWLSNNVEAGGTVFIFYSGHGAPNPKTGDAYLVPYDGDPSFIDKTGYSLRRMYDALGKLPAKEIIVALDSCFSGAGGRSVLAEGARPLVMNLKNATNVPKNMTVLAAASGDQISSTYKDKGHGLFTYFMLKGIKHEDVTRPDGSIKIDDLYSYVKPQVERIARKQYNNEQTPQLIESKR
jgi:hypothetical protein